MWELMDIDGMVKLADILSHLGGWGLAVLFVKLWMDKDKQLGLVQEARLVQAKEQSKELLEVALKTSEHISEQTNNIETLKDSVVNLTSELRVSLAQRGHRE